MNNLKKDFPIFVNKKISYLDNGATTQKPLQVLEKVNKFYKNINANPHRGTYELSIDATNAYEKSRLKISKFINSPSENQIIFTKNATESLNLIAYSYGLNNIKKDDEIVISIMEHHSNLVPWQYVARKNNAILNYMYIDNNYELSEKEINEKITSNTKIVGITSISNVLGTINPVKQIIRIAHEKGAIVVLDASQSILHQELDVQDLDADFVVFSGHKMLAPLGIGILYAKRELLEDMSPFLMGGDMIKYVYEQKTIFADIPNKFEAGTQNVGGVVGLAAAIEYIENIGYDTILQKEKEITKYAISHLRELNFLDIYATSNMKNLSSVISFNVKNIHPHDVSSILNSEGICIRAGNHCAQPLMRFLNIDSTCRASMCFYNDKEDVDKLIMGLLKTYDIFKKYIKK